MSEADSVDASRRNGRRWVYLIAGVSCLGLVLLVGLVLAIFLWPWFAYFFG